MVASEARYVCSDAYGCVTHVPTAESILLAPRSQYTTPTTATKAKMHALTLHDRTCQQDDLQDFIALHPSRKINL